MTRRPGSMLWTALLGLALAAPARGQSPTTLEAVRLHRPSALELTRAELARCGSCPDRARLSLLVGYLALSAGDAVGARDQLRAVPPPPQLAAHHGFYLGQALFYARDPAGAAARFAAVLPTAPPGLAPRLRARLGEAYLAAGDPAQALPYLDQAISELDLPELYAHRARARAAQGDGEGERSDLRTLAIRFPAHPLSAGALARLETAQPQPLTLEERLDRIRTLLDADPAAALEELTALQKRKLDRGASATARVALAAATALYALGRDAEAGEQVARAREGPPEVAAEAAMLQAWRALRQDRNAEARERMAEIEQRYPKTRRAAEAGYMAGWIDVKMGALERAVRSLEDYERRHSRSRHRDDALWFRALALVRLERYVEARDALRRLTREMPRSQLVPQALYWTARSRQLAGEPSAEVADEYRQVIQAFPGSFYGWLADARLRELGQQPPRPFPESPRRMEGALPPALEVAAALARAGLFRDAGLEVEQQMSAVRSAEQAISYGHALQKLGEYGQAHQLAVRRLWGRAFNERSGKALALFFPRAFQQAVEVEAKAQGIPPALIWAIMRRESAFRPDVRSAANARGLMQILPATGTAVAKELAQRLPDPDELYSPELNIRLGAWYLGALMKRFKHPTLSAAAYNAGPPAALRWIRQHGALPLDLFVELIPYKETRGYVKQVLADLHNYRALYEPGAPSPPLTLALPTPDESGVAF